MPKKVLILFFLGLQIFCVANLLCAFQANPYVHEEYWSSINHYLLPQDHPIKPLLDAIFSASRATATESTLLEAGFEIIAHMPRSFVIVARHPAIPGYVFKLYLDEELRCKDNIPNYVWLTRRCVGAERIRNLIKDKKLRYFEVPDKWLYLFPLELEPYGSNPQPLLLIATDMELQSDAVTQYAWRSMIKKKHLRELYAVLKRGYGSTGLDGNVPFTKHQKFAFTDTEHPIRVHNLRRIKPHLSKEMWEYWKELID